MKLETPEISITPEGPQIYVGLPPLESLPPIRAEELIAKSKKTIEIVTIPKLADPTANRKNVGIGLDEEHILRILSSRYETVTITKIETHNDLVKLVTRAPDLVLSGVKYFDFDGETLWLNDYLDLFDINYMASSRDALDRESDKSRAKEIVQKAGVATARYFTTGPGEHPTADSLPIAFPMFVKPITGGDSRGIDANSFVDDFAGFHAKTVEINKTQDSRCLVETYLSGKEYSVGIFEDRRTGKLTAMPIEISVAENENGHCILDFEIKRNDSETVCAVTDKKVHRQLCTLAKKAFKALNGKLLGRIDVKMNADGVPHFVEANLMPGLRKGYFYRSCLLNLNMSYEQMILKIADNGLSQH